MELQKYYETASDDQFSPLKFSQELFPLRKQFWDLACSLEQLVHLLSGGSQALDSSSLSNSLLAMVLEISHHLKIFLTLRFTNNHIAFYHPVHLLTQAQAYDLTLFEFWHSSSLE